jgi:hypothetical protein
VCRQEIALMPKSVNNLRRYKRNESWRKNCDYQNNEMESPFYRHQVVVVTPWFSTPHSQGFTCPMLTKWIVGCRLLHESMLVGGLATPVSGVGAQVILRYTCLDLALAIESRSSELWELAWGAGWISCSLMNMGSLCRLKDHCTLDKKTTMPLVGWLCFRLG